MDFPSFDQDSDLAINFFSEQTDFKLEDESLIFNWIKSIFEKEEKSFTEVNYIFCDDAYLLEKNLEYLQHDTLTDIITFQYSTSPISGDIFISIERVLENAKERNLAFDTELSRVMAHGILHLCGYGDKGEDAIKIMRQKEEDCMAFLA